MAIKVNMKQIIKTAVSLTLMYETVLYCDHSP